MAATSLQHLNNAMRPREIEEPLNLALVHPLSRALLPFAVRARIHPNAISVFGIVFGLVAAVAFSRWDDPVFASCGFVAMLCWHVLDGLDGMVARATGKTSAFGKFLDGVCDYSVFFAVYISLIIALSKTYSPWLVTTIAVLAGIAHAVQAAYYESLRALFRGEPPPPPGKAAGGSLEGLYNATQRRLASRGVQFLDRARSAPDLVQRLAHLIKYANILAPTARTLGIWIACLIASPIAYWLWEICVLTILTFVVSRNFKHILATAPSPSSPN